LMEDSSEMRLIFASCLTLALLLLAGCNTLTPAQDAALACLGTQLGAELAATHANPVLAAQANADGTTLCTFATGASVIIGAPKK
jgi:hypothetical protein